MGFGKIRLDKADMVFSKYVRARDGFACVRCCKKYPGGKGLQASHYFGRGMESTRFDPQNVDTLCAGCHQYWGSVDRESYRQFKVRQLGKAGFDYLDLRAHQTGKKDRKLMFIVWSQAYKNILKANGSSLNKI